MTQTSGVPVLALPQPEEADAELRDALAILYSSLNHDVSVGLRHAASFCEIMDDRQGQTDEERSLRGRQVAASASDSQKVLNIMIGLARAAMRPEAAAPVNLQEMAKAAQHEAGTDFAIDLPEDQLSVPPLKTHDILVSFLRTLDALVDDKDSLSVRLEGDQDALRIVGQGASGQVRPIGLPRFFKPFKFKHEFPPGKTKPAIFTIKLFAAWMGGASSVHAWPEGNGFCLQAVIPAKAA